MVELDEPIQVEVLFGAGQVRPVWFRWRGRRIEVKAVTLRWDSRQGAEFLTHFAVSDGLNLYELTFHPRRFAWYLTKVKDTDA